MDNNGNGNLIDIFSTLLLIQLVDGYEEIGWLQTTPQLIQFNLQYTNTIQHEAWFC